MTLLCKKSMKKFLTLCTALLASCLLVNAQDNYNEISLPELMKKKQQDKDILILDVRSRGEYHDTISRGLHSNIGKIKGAINLPLQEVRENPDLIHQLDAYRDKDIYVICSHSYRSRNISNILLKNGFTKVNNVQGGMTEWYRRYDELLPYRDQLETGIAYKNTSAAEVAGELTSGKKILLIGIAGNPRYHYDTLTINFYNHFPAFKNAVYYALADSLEVLKKVQQNKKVPVVLFNTVNSGAAEIANWLTSKGIPDVSYMVGNLYYFHEYIRNNGLEAKTAKFFSPKNNIDFISSPNLCSKVDGKNVQLIDLRHDSIFNRTTKGLKYEFAHARGSVNFPFENGPADFEKTFTDRKKDYVLYSLNGIDGLELAAELAKKGYRISWLSGGLQRLEWYTINVENFACRDILRP